ncbi:hypothetical protein GCM10009116_20860 [Brevundimonas basaltis]|uniref:antitoxin MazE family protein n=1 Tax=Brevundimonas basaltis TaxID=472166 RepID=UPI001606E21E|nr:antitoxin MazE family protein [Brevundimonas basaltis]
MTSSARRVADHRSALRAQGLRPVQMWVPDTRAPGYAERVRCQLEALRTDPREARLLEELDEFADWGDFD